MESVNTFHDTTLSAIENVPLDFSSGPMDFQVHVTNRATFEVLLGRFFFKLTSCCTNDLPNRDQDIVITDSNTRKELRFLTIPWVKCCDHCLNGEHSVEHSAKAKAKEKGF